MATVAATIAGCITEIASVARRGLRHCDGIGRNASRWYMKNHGSTACAKFHTGAVLNWASSSTHWQTNWNTAIRSPSRHVSAWPCNCEGSTGKGLLARVCDLNPDRYRTSRRCPYAPRYREGAQYHKQ